MAAPTIVGSVITEIDSGNFRGAAGTPITITMPGAPTEGNLIVAGVTTRNATVDTVPQFTISGAGWTLDDEIGNTGPNNSDSIMGIWTRTAGASEPGSYTVTQTADRQTTFVAFTIEISGADTTTPIHLASYADTTGGSISALTASEITTTLDDCLILAPFNVVNLLANTISISGTGWTEDTEVQSGTDSWDTTFVLATKTMSGQGLTADCVATPSTGNVEGAWSQIAIAPSAVSPITIEVLPGGTPY